MKRGNVIDFKMFYLILLCVFFAAAIITIFIRASAAYAPALSDEPIGVRQTALLNTISISDQMLLYLDTAARLAAIEAAGSTLDRAALTEGCGTYAGYDVWSSPQEECFPSQQEAMKTFEREVENNLRRQMSFPGFPRIDYSISSKIISGNLQVIGISRHDIVLPIIAAKDSTNAGVQGLILEEGLSRSKAGFAADARMPLAVMPAGEGTPREEGIDSIIIHSTKTLSVSDAINQYEQGKGSTHYLIDTQGQITQTQPESLKAEHLPCCEEEKTSISVSLVNLGVTEEDTIEGECVRGLESEGSCWEKFPSAQRDALKDLLTDISKRRNILPDKILLASELSGEEDPGPAFNQGGGWWDSFRAAVGTETLQEDQLEERTTLLSAATFAWPTSEREITRCYGPDSQGSVLDGIRMRTGRNSEVVAVSAGSVLQVCPEGINRCSTFDNKGHGNSIILEHDGGQGKFYTRYSQLSDILIPGYEGAKGVVGVTVNQGDVIAKASELEFRYYRSIEEIPDGTSKQKMGSDPLCIIPQEDLKRLYSEETQCAEFKEDKVFQRLNCEAEPLVSSNNCAQTLVTWTGKSDSSVTNTIARLQALPGRGPKSIIDEINEAAEANQIDPKFQIAQIHAETNGDPTLVSYVGAAGLSQFIYSTATAYFAGMPTQDGGTVDISKLKKCGCADSKTCSLHDKSCSPTDPRFDPVASVWAQAKYEADLHRQFDENMILAAAAYNCGPRCAKRALDKAGTTEWDALKPHLPKETQGYVERIMSAYEAQGGQVGHTYTDVQCAGMNVKNFGEYSFKPNFKTEIPNPFGPLVQTSNFFERLHERCDGSGGIDNEECMEEQLESFNVIGAEIVDCQEVEGARSMAREFSKTVSDCKANGQDQCACTWKPPQSGKISGTFRISGESGFTEDVNLGREWSTLFQQNPESERLDVPVEVTLRGKENSDFQLVEITSKESAIGDLVRDKEHLAPGVMIYKDGEDIVIMPESEDINSCGEYKTTHHVCVDVEDEILKFALYLEDDVAPPATDKICAYNITTQIFAAWAQPEADDVSYYEVTCKAPDSEIEAEPMQILPTQTMPIELDMIEDCGVGLQEYEIKVVAIDKSGNRGEVKAKTFPDKDWLSEITGAPINENVISCIN